MNSRERFVAACRGLPVDRPPVWLMRQAGRYLPEYRAVREKHSFWEMMRTPELAVEVTLQPIRRYGMDAAILFSDILIVQDALGAKVDYRPGGIVITPKVHTEQDLASLRDKPEPGAFGYITEAVSRLAKALHPEVALIGFAGAPFTLAAYLVDEGPSHTIEQIKAMASGQPDLYRRLLERIADTVTELLAVQIRAGADAVQIFDTWSGLLTTEEYRKMALPYTRRIVEGLGQYGVPVLLYVRNAAANLEAAAESGCSVLSIDTSLSLKDARARLGADRPLQGNFDPAYLSLDPGEIRKRVHEMIDATGGRGHVVNLGQGLEPESSMEGVGALVQAVKEWKP